ncbi:MAG: DUF6868 family protein [Pseudomonadota bacterium]
MTTFETIRAVLGWCTVLNFGLLLVAGVVLMLGREPIKRIHKRLYGQSETDLDAAYFSFLANYKMLIIVFNLTPYLAMRIVG